LKGRKMKRICCIVLLLLSLSALGFPQEAVSDLFVILTVPLEAGPGFEEDAVQLFDAMNAEMAWLGANSDMFTISVSQGLTSPPPPSKGNLSLADQEVDPRYVITGSIFEDEGMRIFEIYLWKMEDSSLMGSQELAYNDATEALTFIPFFMWTMYSTLPADKKAAEQEDIRWKNKWFYLGLQAGGSTRFYLPVDNGPRGVALVYNGGLRFETQFLSFISPGKFFSLSFQTGADITVDLPRYSNHEVLWGDWLGETIPNLRKTELEFEALSLMVPAILKFNIKPGKFVIAPYGGVYYSFIFSKNWTGDLTLSPPFGVMAGVSVGRKLGIGVLSLDIGYGFDLGNTKITIENSGMSSLRAGASDEGLIQYWRHQLSLSVRYDFGFLDRKVRVKEEAQEESY
jgi:hypothetical protein